MMKSSPSRHYQILSMLLCMIVGMVLAFPDAAEAIQEKRVALVIGNSTYKVSPLANPVNDATDIAAKLESFGFEVFHYSNASQREMEQSIRKFHRALFQEGTVGLFYYAGHALELQGSNYLIPVDADIQAESDIKYETVDVGRLLDGMSEANNGLNIVILDACRNNPFARSLRSVGRGLTPSNPASGTIILYATEPTNVAQDGDGRNGTFTEHLLATMSEPGLTVEEVFKHTAIKVNRVTDGSQTPWSEGFILGNFYFVPPQPRMSLSLSSPVYKMPSTPTAYSPSAAAVNTPPPPPPPISVASLTPVPPAPSSFVSTRPTATSRVGFLQVKVNVKANIYVDGQEKGTSFPEFPLNITGGLPGGKVHVYAKADGYETNGQFVEIKPDAWQVATLNLRATGSHWTSGASSTSIAPPPPPPAPVTLEDNIEKTLAACAVYLKANRLTVGKNNAASCFKKVLRIDPYNADALEGMAAIEAKYHALARGAVNKKNAQQTRTYISRLEKLNPNHYALSELKSEAVALERAASPPPAPTPVAAPPPVMVASSAPSAPMTRQYDKTVSAPAASALNAQPANLVDTQLAQIKQEMARRDCLYKADTNRLQCERDNNKDHHECMEQRRSEAKYQYETALSSYMLKNQQFKSCERDFWIEDKKRKAEEEEERNNRMIDHQTIVSTLPPRKYTSVRQKCGTAPQEPKSSAFLDVSSCKQARDCGNEYQQQRSMCDMF
jgi:hypothetical protein